MRCAAINFVSDYVGRKYLRACAGHFTKLLPKVKLLRGEELRIKESMTGRQAPTGKFRPALLLTIDLSAQ